MAEPRTDHHPRIRTHHARHGRITPTMREALDRLGPRYAPDWSRADRPRVLEVGCGNGSAALAYAAAHPDHHVIALDVHAPGIAQLLAAVDAEGRSNVSTAILDAVDVLDEHIEPAGLTGLHLFFPDPWPKSRHHKRRFVRPDVLDLVADRLEVGGQLLLATDAADYAAAMIETLAVHPLFDGGPAPRPTWRPTTTYERKARADHRPVTELTYRRTG